MLGTSCEVVMVVVIVLVIGKITLISDKANELGHVDALGEVFNVQA